MAGKSFTQDNVSPCHDSPLSWISHCLHDSDSPDLPVPVVGNYTYQGNSKELVMVRNHHNELTYIDFTKDVARDNLLVKVTTSGGEQTYEVSYKPMQAGTLNLGSPNTPLYSVSEPAQYPSALFYGSDHPDIAERPLQKYYSTDSSIEVKTNTTTGDTAFIHYIGDDAYSAPVVLKSDGQTHQFLYLHRDYLGSILAITNQNGQLLEKRHFDA